MTESRVLPWTLPGSSYRKQKTDHGCNTMNQKANTESNKGEEAKMKINLKINFRKKVGCKSIPSLSFYFLCLHLPLVLAPRRQRLDLAFIP